MAATPLIPDALVELLELASQSDSVELKLTVPESAQRSAVRSLDLDPLNAQIRQVFFFDTPDLTLNEAGLVVRARRVQGKGDDSVVKLRPVVPAELPEAVRRSPNLVVEVDTMPGGYVCSASLRAKPAPASMWGVFHGEGSISNLFTKEQRAFYADHAPDGVELDSLSILGPIFVLKVTFSPEDYQRGRIVGEFWLYPDGERILELSTKCTPPDLVATALDARAFLRGRGVEIGGDQQTKTKTALEFFSAELARTG